MSEKLSNLHSIVMYLHCAKCLDERPNGTSPAEWARLAAGWTKQGLQLWCERHNVNVCHIDFEGVRHPAITTAAQPPTQQ